MSPQAKYYIGLKLTSTGRRQAAGVLAWVLTFLAHTPLRVSGSEIYTAPTTLTPSPPPQSSLSVLVVSIYIYTVFVSLQPICKSILPFDTCNKSASEAAARLIVSSTPNSSTPALHCKEVNMSLLLTIGMDTPAFWLHAATLWFGVRRQLVQIFTYSTFKVVLPHWTETTNVRTLSANK